MNTQYIGIDGGGTKTALVAANEDGAVIKEAQTTGSSWREHGIAEVAALIAEAVSGMGCRNIGGIAAGMPCYGESADGDAALRTELENVFPGIPLYLTNDVEVGWAGAFALKPGVHLVSGTGSIAYGVDSKGTGVRCGGWDNLYSDEGSAYWIARKGMELFSKQSDGRLPEGPLLQIIRNELSLSRDIDFIDYIHKHHAQSRKERAAFQVLVAKAARAGDRAAAEIYADAAAELCLMAEAIRRKLDLPPDGWHVSYSGGVFETRELILDPLKELIENAGGKLCKPLHPPVIGALLIALKHFSSGVTKN